MDISAKIDEKTVNKIKKEYQDYLLDNPNEYAVLFMKIPKITITVFKNKKGLYSISIMGSNDKKINEIIKKYKLEVKKKIETENKKDTYPKGFAFLEDQIGSDEVGTGDFFGPITVVASVVKHTDLPRLKELGVMDSKKLSDDKIRKIGKIVVKEFKYSSLTLDNKKYNEVVDKGLNMNAIKAKMHNRALSNLKKKYPNIDNIYVDKFCEEKLYYSYLKDDTPLHGIYFHTKGESYFPSVALSSVIARYSFLIRIDELNKKYNISIPLGGGAHVDTFAKSFMKKYGIDELNKIVKKNFKNYKRVVE